MSSTDIPVTNSGPPPADVDTSPEVDENIDEDNVTDPIETTLPSMDGSNDAPDTGSPSTRAAEPNTAELAENQEIKAEDGIQPEIVEPRIPAKKDATLREFLGKMDDFAPIVRPLYHPTRCLLS